MPTGYRWKERNTVKAQVIYREREWSVFPLALLGSNAPLLHYTFTNSNGLTVTAGPYTSPSLNHSVPACTHGKADQKKSSSSLSRSLVLHSPLFSLGRNGGTFAISTGWWSRPLSPCSFLYAFISKLFHFPLTAVCCLSLFSNFHHQELFSTPAHI